MIRPQRAALGLLHSELFKSAGVSIRQLARYEAGEQQPAISAAVHLADVLGMSLARVAGQVDYGLELTGEWWCSWQTWKDGVPRVDTHSLEIEQRGELLHLDAQRTAFVSEGSYQWRGELRL